MLPRVLQRVNLTDWGSLRTNSRSIHAEMCRQILIYSITAIILGLIVYQITPGFIHQFFPHYEPGITALFYLLPGLLLYGIREILFGYLMLKKKRSLAVGFDSLTLITSFALYWIIHRFFSASIEGIAAATSLSYSFNTLLYIGYILRTEGLSFGPTGTETG